MKRLLVISYGRLIGNGSAGSTVMCGLVEAALRRGMRVTHVALVQAGVDQSWEQPYPFPTDERCLRRLELHYSRDLLTGHERPSFFEWCRLYIRSFLGHFDHALIRRIVEPLPEALKERYDGVVAFEPLAIFVAKEVGTPYRLAILGDPTGRLLWHSTGTSDLRAKCRALLLDVSEVLYFRFVLDKSWRIGMFGTRHARSWSRGLGRPVLDLRPFVPQALLPAPHGEAGGKLIINFGGTLATTASKQFFEPFFDRMLPTLIRTLGADRFEIRLIGDCPEDIRRHAAQFENVHVAGRVASFEGELAKGHVFLLPMNYPVGVRTRVCSALAAGNVCVLDESILQNMPELRDCDAIRFVDANDLSSEAIVRALEWDDLGKLRECARTFFAEHYWADVAASKILESI